MAKTEDIEAKLAAYIDGEIDEAGRAQIEQHLRDNPQHRQLIQELTQQKQLLSALPRQSAPPEVGEAFTAQLERAVLLGDVDARSEHAPAMRIGYFSPLRAAAILMLTTGLAGLVWYLLPSSAPSPELANLSELRLRTTPSGVSSAPVTVETDPMAAALAERARVDAALADRVTAVATAAPSRETDSIVTEITSGVAGRGAGGGGRGGGGAIGDNGAVVGGGALGGAFSNSAEPSNTTGREDLGGFNNSRRLDIANRVEPVNERIAGDGFIGDELKLGPPAPESMLYVFSSDRPEVADEQVKRYLTSNGIAWESEAQPMPAPLGLGLTQSQGALTSRFNNQNVQIKSIPAEPPGTQVAQQQQQQQFQNNSNSNRIVARQMPRSQAVQVVTDLQSMQGQRANNNSESLTLRANAGARLENSRDSAVELQGNPTMPVIQPERMARANGILESNVMSNNGFTIIPPPPPGGAPPSTLPMDQTLTPSPVFDPTKLQYGALGPAEALPVAEGQLPFKEAAPEPAPVEQKVDMVIVVQPSNTPEAAGAVPATQPQPEQPAP